MTTYLKRGSFCSVVKRLAHGFEDKFTWKLYGLGLGLAWLGLAWMGLSVALTARLLGLGWFELL